MVLILRSVWQQLQIALNNLRQFPQGICEGVSSYPGALLRVIKAKSITVRCVPWQLLQSPLPQQLKQRLVDVVVAFAQLVLLQQAAGRQLVEVGACAAAGAPVASVGAWR